MDLEEKKRVILETSKTIPKRRIDVTGKGNAVKRLELGQSVSEQKIDGMYKAVTALTQKAKEVTPRSDFPNISISLVNQIAQRLDKLEEKFEEVVGSLLLRVEALEKSKAKLVTEEREKPAKVLGFSICLKPVVANGRKYQKWHAVRYFNGKQIWIYLGNSPDEAENKITDYCQRKGLPLPHESQG